MGYSSNIASVISLTVEQLKGLANPDGLLRELAQTQLVNMKVRVHRDGLASDGQRIGTYSPGYMTTRTGNYKNADRFSRGAKKGQNKNVGTISKGEATGAKRTRYNLPADTKVIGVLTGQTQNDEKTIALQDGYGIGFTNSDNYDKSQYLEETYGKPIWKPTAEEEKGFDDVINAYLDKNLS